MQGQKKEEINQQNHSLITNRIDQKQSEQNSLTINTDTHIIKDQLNATNVPIDPFDLNVQQIQTLKEKKEDNNNTHNAAYKAYIDGLRAIAITTVVIFHAWPKTLTGGYIGVDVFFVISGYLITGSKKQIFLFQFYTRRIKRIYPALILVLAFAFVIGIKFLEQRNLQIMSKTMAASTIFGANIEILNYEQDYFDPEVKTNPLLHLWSLGVQQQFYIFWPLFICNIVKISSKKAMAAMLAFVLLSFAFNIQRVYQDAKFDFYFPLCRFWQMAVGGFIAYFNKDIKNKIASNILSILSCVTIFYVSFIITENSLFPGFWALAPTLSSALIISTQNSLLNQYILSNSVIVFIGKISYPLYLWHWPLLVFSRVFYGQQSEQLLSKTWFIIILSIVFSIITYFFVENKLRFSKKNTVVFTLLISMILIGLLSFYTYENPSKMSLQNKQLFDQSLFQDQQQNVQKQQNTLNIENKQFNEIQKEILKDKKGKQLQSQLHIGNQQGKKQINVDKINESKILNVKNNSSVNNQKNNSNISISNNKKKVNTKTFFQRIGVNISKKYQLQMIPTQNDYYIKDGRKIPNISKNPKRLPITKAKVQYSNKVVSQYNRKDPGALSVSPVTRKSKYYQRVPFQLGKTRGKYNVANQGRQNKLFVIGDSYGEFVGWRFRKLYEQSRQKGQLDKFPTILHMTQKGSRFTHCSQHYNLTINLVKKHKPKRIFFSYYWIYDFQNFDSNAKQQQYEHTWQNCKAQKNRAKRSRNVFIDNFKMAMQVWKQFVQSGIEVYSLGFHPYGDQFNPKLMDNKKPEYYNELKPVKLSQFRNKHKQWIDFYQNTMKQIGVKIIDISQNQCWNDICQVASPTGYPVYYDMNHYNLPYSFYWLSAVDFLTEF